MIRQRPEPSSAAALLPFVDAWRPQPELHDTLARVWVRWLSITLLDMSTELAARQGRRELVKLDDRLLKDIGVSRCELLAGRTETLGDRK